jgi:hypothetical protein
MSTSPGSDIMRNLTEAARAHPVSTALIGMGVLWLFTGARGIDTILMPARGGRDDDAASTARAGEAPGGTAKDMHETSVGLGSAGSDHPDEIPQMPGSLFDDIRANVAELFQAQPLALGAVGLAIGAAVGASLPVSETEGAYVGESSQFVKNKAGEIIGEQAERTANIGRRVINAVSDEARQQGLTPTDLKAAANKISNKVGRVADAARGHGPS